MSDGPILDQVNLVVSDMEVTRRLLSQARSDHRRAAARMERPPSDGRDAGRPRARVRQSAVRRVMGSGLATGPTSQRPRLQGRHGEEVDEIYARLTDAGAKAQQSPIDAFWGSRYAVVEDPDGNAVGIMSPPETEHQSPGPSF